MHRHQAVIDQTAESLFRVQEFRKWIDTNVLFPTVPDVVRDPLRAALRQVEHILVAELYDCEQLDRVTALLVGIKKQVMTNATDR